MTVRKNVFYLDGKTKQSQIIVVSQQLITPNSNSDLTNNSLKLSTNQNTKQSTNPKSK